MTRTRNPEACCGNCPMGREGASRTPGTGGHKLAIFCCKYPREVEKEPKDFCGEHPDFWVEEENERFHGLPGDLCEQHRFNSKDGEGRVFCSGCGLYGSGCAVCGIVGVCLTSYGGLMYCDEHYAKKVSR